MFRELTRIKNKLANKECIEILKNEKRGVLSVIGDNGYPYGMPMNHFYNEQDGCIYFHSGKTGHREEAIKANNKASFCVYDEGYKNDGDWALNIKSVIVFGTVEVIDDINIVVNIANKLSQKFTNDQEYIQNEIKNYALKTAILKLTPQHICGKIVKEA